MPRLPYLDRAVVSENKVVNYLLSVRHSGGRAKARFLENFGFRVQDWRVLRDANHSRSGERYNRITSDWLRDQV